MRVKSIHWARRILLWIMLLAIAAGALVFWQEAYGSVGPVWLQNLFGSSTVLNGRHVGIVAGHSGNDSGAVCPDGLTEASVNQSVAQAVVKNLKRHGASVDLLTEFDSGLQGYQADALVSIHTDSCGVELSGFKVADQEGGNQASERLVSCLWQGYEAATKLQRHVDTITPDMRDYHAFRQIAQTTPAAIIEIGFLKGDRGLLVNHPERAASGIVSGIECFLAPTD